MRLGLIGICVMLVLTACSRRQNAKGDVNFIDDRITNKEVLLKHVGDSLFTQKYFAFKSDLYTDFDGSDMDLKLTAKVVLDSAIEIRLKKASIPVIKLLITKDSIYLRNDLEKTILLEDYIYLEKVLDFTVDFDLIQKLILGRPYYYYAQIQYEYHEDKPYHLLTSTPKRKLKKQLKQEENPEAIFGDADMDKEQEILIQALWFNGFERSLASMFVKEPKENRKLWLNYNDRMFLNGQSIPKQLAIDLKIKNNKKKRMELKHSKLLKKDPFKLKFKTPSKYEVLH